MKKVNLDQAGPAWHKWRQRGIGGSDACAVMADAHITTRSDRRPGLSPSPSSELNETTVTQAGAALKGWPPAPAQHPLQGACGVRAGTGGRVGGPDGPSPCSLLLSPFFSAEREET